jgi:hypothetical protein
VACSLRDVDGSPRGHYGAIMLPEEPDIVGAHDDDGEHGARAARWFAIAGNRRLQAACAAVLVAAVAIVITVAPRHQPASADVAQLGVTNLRSTGVFNAFAGGAVDGQGWQLTVQNVATDGHSCLPAVVLSGQYGDPLFRHPDLGLTPAGSVSVISEVPGAPDASFAFFRVPATVARLRVAIGAAAPLILTPAGDAECGVTFRLAGFGFATMARVTVTALTGRGASAPYTLPYALAHPSPTTPDPDGWQNLDRQAGWGTPHLIDRVRVDGTLWGLTVAVGAYGECFSLIHEGRVELRSPRCSSLNPTGEDVPLGGSGSVGNALAVYSDVALVSAMVPGVGTARASPVDIGGRLYVGLITAAPPDGITCYDASGAIISGINRSPGEPW